MCKEASVKKVWEYYQHAKECRSLARSVSGEQQKLLLQMSRNWERLAAERNELTQRHPELTIEKDAVMPIHAGSSDATTGK